MNALVKSLPNKDLLQRVLSNYGDNSKSDSARQSFVNQHIELLEASDNDAVSRSGFVLRRAQEGFGLGYKVPLAIVSLGQVMLGIDFATSAPFIASNPAAFTCAAIGAVYYGYKALGDDERQSLHRLIGDAIDVGLELVRSIIEFFISTLKSMLDKETLSNVRDLVADYARLAGSSLSVITGKATDKAWEIGQSAIGGAGSVANTAIGAASSAWGFTSEKLLGSRETGK